MLGGIRARLLGLLLVMVVPFIVLAGANLWMQWKLDEAASMRSALGEAQRIAQHLDDEIGNFDSLIAGLSWAVSVDPAQKASNDALLRRAKAELPA